MVKSVVRPKILLFTVPKIIFISSVKPTLLRCEWVQRSEYMLFSDGTFSDGMFSDGNQNIYSMFIVQYLSVFWIRIHYNADPDAGPSEAPFGSGSRSRVSNY